MKRFAVIVFPGSNCDHDAYHVIKLMENSFTTKQLFNADEVFLTSSGSFVTPIIKIDSQLINNGKIGKVTFLLAQSYFKTFK